MIRRDVALLARSRNSLGKGNLHTVVPCAEAPGAGAAGARLGTDAWRSGNVARRRCSAALPRRCAESGIWRLARDMRQSFLPRKFPEIPGPRR